MADIASNDGRLWFALFARPRMEALALGSVRQRGYEAWMPLCIVQRRHARRIEVIRAPLFPRYLFLAVLDGEQALAPALHAAGVVGVVRARAGLPVPMQPEALRELRARLDAEGGAVDLRPRTVTEHYAIGERVTIPVGPHAGMPAIVEAAARGKIVMALDILGRKVRLSIRGRDAPAISPSID